MAIPEKTPMPYVPITGEQLRQTIKGKKARSATGPDGWSRKDILRMSPDLLQSVADLFTWVEAGHQWPLTMVTGIVHSLEKRSDPTQVNHYRPITVFSLLYRAWSSIRSRQLLDFLSDKIPARCFGNAPKKTTKDVWFGLQLMLEDHYFSGTPLSGCMLDLEKAFNHLPRVPIIKLGAVLGIPSQILHAWGSALTTMVRRFHIRGATGPALHSSSGLPEGCGMSVVGMMLINVLTDRWLTVRVPRCCMWSYVDNLELTSQEVSQVQAGHDELHKVCDLLALPIDVQKTIFWSTNAQDRQDLRSSNQKVVYWMRDLGGHVQYTKQLTNSVITSKIEKFQPRWQALACSKASYKRKLLAIKTVALPNILHGIASAFVGNAHFDGLRTSALQAIGEHRPGASPLVHFSLVCHPTADPTFFAIWNTLLEIRKYTTSESLSPVLTETTKMPSIYPKPGPGHVLLQRMQQLHWHWNMSDSFVDQSNQTVDLWNCPIQELMVRATEAWQQQVAGQTSLRKTFQGMQYTHAHLSTRQLPTDPIDQGLLRTVMNGTFYTADHLPKRDESLSDTCPYCGQVDSVLHRNWHCPALEEARVECPQHIKKMVLDMPPAVQNHGWFPTPSTLLCFRQALGNTPDTTQDFQHIPHEPQELDLFTDGSCLGPADSLTRVAGWGVVVATPIGESDFAPVSSGLVRGWYQSITRAELQAAISAVSFAVHRSKPFRLWVDSSSVVSRIRQFARTTDFTAHVNKPNHDLLQRLFDIMSQAKHLFRGVVKVYSHQNLQAGFSPSEQWAFRGNHAADELAAMEFSNHTELMTLRQKLLEEVKHLETLRNWTHRMFVQVGRKALTINKTQLLQKQHNEDPRQDLQLEPLVMQ
eukprot:s432_g9.t1